MKSNNSDKFIATNITSSLQENFFLNENFNAVKGVSPTTEQIRRLNDYDSNILQDGAYRDIDDELLKLEYKMAKIEDEVKNLNLQLIAMNEIADIEAVKNLEQRKMLLEQEYESLLFSYNAKGIPSKITGSFTKFTIKNNNVFSQKFRSKIDKIIAFLSSKLPKSLNSALELKKSLTKLETLNKSVDELVSMNIPYGENVNKYEQLSKYIIKANSIQAELAKHIKK